MYYCAICENIECRCESCFALTERNSQWYCETYEDYCNNITCCLLYDESSGCEFKYL